MHNVIEIASFVSYCTLNTQSIHQIRWCPRTASASTPDSVKHSHLRLVQVLIGICCKQPERPKPSLILPATGRRLHWWSVEQVSHVIVVLSNHEREVSIAQRNQLSYLLRLFVLAVVFKLCPSLSERRIRCSHIRNYVLLDLYVT